MATAIPSPPPGECMAAFCWAQYGGHLPGERVAASSAFAFPVDGIPVVFGKRNRGETAMIKIRFLDGTVREFETLVGANLRGADLRWMDLSGQDLIGADLTRATLYGANLSWANLAGANLTMAKLYGANLTGADLIRADINGEILKSNPIIISNLRWPVLITERYMRIGCERHTHAEWATFSDYAIEAMHPTAAELWRVWKDPLLSMCASHAKLAS
ncbi:MAG: pentapeptide repeat-containing protein [Magnetococcales bacterium]|nr:pentapeptide repeat-containing protein [Magnetococcales bacterium]